MFTKKHRVVLLSLLVFGLLGAAQSAFGQVVFGVSSSTNQARFEGLKEGVGQVVLFTNSAGTIKSGSIITVNYQAPIANAASVGIADVSCLNTGAGGSACAGNFSVAASGNTLTMTFTADINFVDSNTIVFFGVRVDANAYGSAVAVVVENAVVSAGVPAAFVGINPITFTGPTAVPVADINPRALTVTLTTGPGFQPATQSGPAAILTCNPPISDPSDSETAPFALFTLSITENFNQALTSQSDEDGISDTPEETNGSNILITFTGVPNTVTVEEETVVATTLGLGAIVSPTGATSAVANGTVSWFIPVTATNFLGIDTLTIQFDAYTSSATLPVGLLPNAITATVQLTDTNPSVSTNTPTFVTNVNEGSLVVVNISDCVTYLLFPWVTNFNVAGNPAAGAHFDTGLTFANTSGDPFGPAGAFPAAFPALPQTGPCSSVMFANDGTVSAPVSTAPILPGGTAVIDAANTFPGKSGYVFSRCGFQGAHAFTYITDNWPMPPNTSVAYLGLVLPNPNIVARNPAGGGAGEGLVH